MKAELTKGDVYVVVDTPKKEKKLKNLLDMFDEPIFNPPNHEYSGHNGSDYGWGYGFSNELWQGFNTKSLVHNGKDFKKVSIKELRNILAKENLRKGDYVVSENNFICRIDKIENCGIYFSNPFVGVYDISYFKRYATPEEIALLEPKQKELEVGKWYKYSYNCNNKHYGYLLFNFNGSFGEDSQIGFTHTSTGQVFVDDISIYNERISEYTDANPQEIESALIEEAKRLGHEYEKYVYNPEENTLCGYNGRLEEVFVDGQWNDPYDKFAELKEAHKNGAVIQFKFGKDYWEDVDFPMWDDNYEYRIKPEEIKDSDIATIEALHDVLLDNHKYDLNSKLLTNARELCKKLQNIVGD